MKQKGYERKSVKVSLSGSKLSSFHTPSELLLRWLVYPDREGRERRLGENFKIEDSSRKRDVDRSTIPLLRSHLDAGECVFPRSQTRHMNKKYPSKLPTTTPVQSSVLEPLEPTLSTAYRGKKWKSKEKNRALSRFTLRSDVGS